ncbi:MAG: sigma-70 family RNA polymerase sigma factor [Bacteroidetes bacterium]|nr:sigma-70 family RNA polymerase sigma factor [Bacteroidota bacterium]
MPQERSDASLLQAVRNGDEAAFRMLYDRYWEGLYLKACQRVDKEVAKDLVQEVMSTLWRRRNDIFTFEDGQIGRYLFTAIKYRVISHYAYSAAELRHTDLFDALNEQAPASSIETKELQEFIESEVRRLPARMQEVFRMSREEDYSITDIAQRLNLSEQTVKNQLTEALKRLRSSISTRDKGDWTFTMFILFYYYYTR